MTAPRDVERARLARAHQADLGGIDALRRMAAVIEAARAAEVRYGPLADRFDRHRHLCTLERFDHELARLREDEADLVNDLHSIAEQGGPSVPSDYRAARAEGTSR